MNEWDDLIEEFVPDLFPHAQQRLRKLCDAVSDRVAAKEKLPTDAIIESNVTRSPLND